MKKMDNKTLDNLEQDIKYLIESNFHPRNLDLMNIVINEDVLELIKFAKKVNKVLESPKPQTSGQYEKGYYAGIEQIKREIYE